MNNRQFKKYWGAQCKQFESGCPVCEAYKLRAFSKQEKVQLKIEQLLCAEIEKEEIVIRLNVTMELVDFVWNRMMREFDDFIANPGPRMSDAEYDQMIADMHGLDLETVNKG